MSFSRTSGCAASAARSDGSGASSTFVAGSTSIPARRASSAAGCPIASRLTLSSQPKANSASRSVSSVLSRWLPSRWSSATISSYTTSSTMQVCSAGQMTEASKVLEIKMSTTAPLRSAVRCT
jgi:hypothetical protein